MGLGNLSVKVTADIGQFQTGLQVVSKTAQEQMGVAGGAVAEYERAMSRAGESTTASAQQIENSMKAANDAIIQGSEKAVESIGQIAEVAKTADMRPLGERIAEAIGTGIGVGIVAAEKGWDAFVEYSKAKAVVVGIAISAAFAAVGLGAVYAGYKVLSGSLDFITGLLTGDSYKNENIDALLKANEQVKEIQKSLGITADQAAITNEALKGLGVDKGDYVAVFTQARDAMTGNKDVLEQLGIQYGSTSELIQSANQKLGEYTEGWERNQVAQLIGIGSASQVADAAKLTATELANAHERLSDYNLGMSTESQAAAAAYTDTTREFQNNLALTQQGFKVAIADNIMPMLTDLADFFKDGFPGAVNAFRYSMATITSLVYGLKIVIYSVLESIVGSLSAAGSMLAGIAFSATSIMRGDLTSAKDELIRGWEGAKDRLGQIYTGISNQAQQSASAMRLAWAFDDRQVPSGVDGKSSKVIVDQIKLAKEQSATYKDLMQSVGLRLEQQDQELKGGEKLGEMQRKLIELRRGLENGTVKLDGDQQKEVLAAMQKAVEQEKRIRQMEHKPAANDGAYDSLVRGMAERISTFKAEAEAMDGVTEGQKAALRILTNLRDGVLDLTLAQRKRVGSLLEEMLTQEQAALAHKEAIKNAEALQKADEQSMQALQTQIDQERVRNQEIGLTKAQIEAVAASRMIDAAATDEQTAAKLREVAASGAAGEFSDAYLQHANQLLRMAAAKRELASIKIDSSDRESIVAQGEAAKKAAEELDRMLDPARGRDFGLAIKGSVGEAISAVVKLDAAFRQYGSNQAMLAKQIELAYKESNGNQETLNSRLNQINRKATESQLANYAAMTGAAKGFFNEQSRGYKALQAAEQVFQMAQLAMTLATTVAKIAGIESVTAATAAGAAAQTAAVEGGVAVQLAADQVKGASAASVAVATQAAGDPYTAWARMAAMAAAMAALGFATGVFGGDDGGSSTLAADRQKTQGTGTVFGDAMAKSESISKSIELLKANSDLLLPVNQAMLISLRAIQSNISGLTNLIVRAGGVTNGGNFGIQEGVISSGNALGNLLTKIPVIGGLLGGIVNLWGKTTQTITDSGIQFSGFVRDLQRGVGYLQYANVQTTESSWFGLKKDTTNSVMTQGLSSELTTQFGLIFTNLEKTLKASAIKLGSSSADVEKVLGSLRIDTTTVSLKGLQGQALQDAISSIISKAMDQMSSAAFPGLDAFRQVGEGYTQTVMRIASGVEVAASVLDKLGVAAVSYTQIIDKQGDVGGEIVRQSILAKEGLSGVGKILEGMTGTAQDLAAAYKEMTDIRKQMAGVGLNGANLGGALINGAGSTKDLSSALSTYQDKYFSDAEKAASATQSVAAEFARLGIAMPRTKDEFRKLIQQTGTGTDAAAKLTGQLLVLSGSFSDMVDAVDKANAAQKQSVQETLDSYASFASSMGRFRESLLLSNSSTLTPQQKYEQAKSQYEKTLALAKSGDKDAQQRIQQAANDFLEASRVVNSSSDAYARDFNSVMNQSAEIEKWAQQQADLARASLDAMNQQVIATGRVEQAVLDLGRRIRVMEDPVVRITDPKGSQNVDFSQYGRPSDVALIDEIKRLNGQVAQLRADANQNANDQVAATYDATERNAQAVSAANVKIQKEVAWQQNNQGVLRR